LNFTDRITVDAAAGVAEGMLEVRRDADYLKDHFPGAPMLPGLVMLEVAVRTAAQLWEARRPGAMPGAALLAHVDRLQIGRRVDPGETFVVRTEIIEAGGEQGAASFVAQGVVAGAPAMRARFRLRWLPAEPGRSDRGD
jgi:3-hydroxymyristoyl/3-hydroxydecanoyl-(acyl carrier protein) dehydratase